MNEQLAAFLEAQGFLTITLAVLPLIIGGVFVTDNREGNRWPAILFTIGIILALAAFVMWSIAIYYRTIA